MATAREPRKPNIPAEIWLHILSSTRDPKFLWSVCRKVSTSFRSHVDTIFRDNYIKDTDIVFNDYLQERCERYVRVATKFDRFSEDKTLVYFKDLDMDSDSDSDSDDYNSRRGPRRIANKHVPRNWKTAMQWYTGPPYGSSNPQELGRPDQPPYTIRVRRYLNDTEIPRLEIDYEKREICFDWRAMYTMFFREEEYIDRQINKLDEQAKVNALTLKAKIDSGEISLMDAMEDVLMRGKRSRDDARRGARRKRLDDVYKAHGLSGFDPDDFPVQEREVLEDLDAERLMLDRTIWSDDESGGEAMRDDEEEDDNEGSEGGE